MMTTLRLLPILIRRIVMVLLASSAMSLWSQDSAGAYIISPDTTQTIKVGDSISFSGSSDFGTRFNWNFGDGTTALGPDVIKTFTTAGTFTVTLTTSGAGLYSSTAYRTIEVKAVAVSVSPTSASLLTGGTQQFSSTVTWTSNTGVTWSCSGGSITSGGYYTAPATAGTYTVTARSVADTTKTASATVTVNYPPVTISVSPTVAQLVYGQQRTFAASVSGGNGNTAVTWSCTGGTVSTGGLYTAPSTSGTYYVTATAQADTSKTATATVTVAAPVSVTVSPKTATLVFGQTQNLSATVTGGFSGTSVTWSTNGGTVNAAGTYTAPGTAGTYTVTATSVSDPSKSDSATLTVVAPVSVSITPSSASMAYGQTQTFVATVTGGTGNTLVTWSCTGGSITTGGVYTAPGTSGTYTVTATSVADSSKAASASVSVTPPVSVGISPTSATLTYGQQQTFTATVTGGTGNTAVTWTASAGTITSAGVFTAPSSSGSVTVTATSVADPLKSASASVNVVPPVGVTISPASATLIYAQQQAFTASVTGGTGNTAVTWTTSGGTITAGGVLTAPSTTTTLTVTATSVADPSKSASSSVSVVPPASVSLSPTAVTMVTGATQTFTASVSGGTGSTAVTWSCSGGSITSTGVFTAPATPGSYTVTATSVSDPSRTATSSVTVVAPVSVSITPTSVALVYAQQQTFTATVNGGPAGSGVTWSCTGGSITSAGVYTAPSTAGTYTVTAINTWDTSKSASATVTVTQPKVVSSVSISPTSLTLDGGQSATFTATVQGSGAIDTTVTWTCTAGSVTPAGVYTAPSTAGTFTVRATSVQDPGKYTEATVTVKVLVWEADIIYVGTKEVAEVDAAGIHVTHVDHLGSPRLVTGPTGQVESRQKYMPYGELADADGAYQTKKGYTNHEQTDVSGLIYMQARFYLPMYGRFGSPDPARDQHFELTQSWNIYSYVRNSPTRLVDPFGLAAKSEDDEKKKKEKIPEATVEVTDRDTKADKISPWGVGVEWLSGTGPRHRTFVAGDRFTEQLRQHDWIKSVLGSIQAGLGDGDLEEGDEGSDPYNLGGIEGVGLYVKDYSTLLTGGMTGNIAVTYLGSYSLTYKIDSVDPKERAASVTIVVKNTSSIESATRPPVIGYTRVWRATVGKWLNNKLQSGPMSQTSQTFIWTEKVKF